MNIEPPESDLGLTTRFERNAIPLTRNLAGAEDLVQDTRGKRKPLMTVDYQDLQINGVRVETYGTPSAAPPLLFVHGGCQGSWAWEKMAPRLAGAGWYAVCLNWFGHYGSKVLPDADAVSRSMLNVTTEIGLVTDWLGRAPVLVAHSMGSVPSLAYASANPVTALILLAPVLPAGLGAGPIDIPVDPAAMWLPPPHMIDATWWGEVSAQEAQRYTSLLSAESPQAVLEATRCLCEIDTRRVDAPALIFAARADPLVPLQGIRALAEAIGATIVTLENTGHGIPLNPVWANVTAQIDPWLRTTTAEKRAFDQTRR
jgi:pimeloyl-ACP methyl ester carboxylesterase